VYADSTWGFAVPTEDQALTWALVSSSSDAASSSPPCLSVVRDPLSTNTEDPEVKEDDANKEEVKVDEAKVCNMHRVHSFLIFIL
jgi:hypothetical protein